MTFFSTSTPGQKSQVHSSPALFSLLIHVNIVAYFVEIYFVLVKTIKAGALTVAEA